MLLHLLLQLNQLPFPMVAPLFAQTSNSNASGNLQTKVLLTVSPFRSSFLQPPALRPANHRFFTPLFSTSSVSLFSQLLCFHIYLRCLLVFFDSGYRFSRDTDSRATNHGVRVHVLSSVSPFRMNTYAKPGGGCPIHVGATGQFPACPACSTLLRPGCSYSPGRPNRHG